MHIKYRPKSFDQVIGNETIVKSIKNLLSKNEVRPIMLYGEKGCGKTTLSHIIARAFGANKHGIIDRNCVHYSGVEAMRELITNLHQPSILSPKKVLILDEVHELSHKAKEELLKPLESDDKSVLYLACTTELEGLKGTFLDRFNMFTVTRLKENESLQLLNYVCEQEKLNISKWLKVLIIEKSEGIPRRLLTGLSKVNIENITEDEAKSLLELNAISEDVNKEIFDLFRIILSRAEWKVLSKALSNVLKENKPNDIRIGLMNIIGGRLLSEYNKGQDNKFLVEAYKSLSNLNNIPEKASLIVSITDLYLGGKAL